MGPGQQDFSCWFPFRPVFHGFPEQPPQKGYHLNTKFPFSAQNQVALSWWFKLWNKGQKVPPKGVPPKKPLPQKRFPQNELPSTPPPSHTKKRFPQNDFQQKSPPPKKKKFPKTSSQKKLPQNKGSSKRIHKKKPPPKTKTKTHEAHPPPPLPPKKEKQQKQRFGPTWTLEVLGGLTRGDRLALAGASGPLAGLEVGDPVTRFSWLLGTILHPAGGLVLEISTELLKLESLFGSPRPTSAKFWL